MVDKRAAAADPFQALLNDPNPIRSMAAMELMIESGVPHLVRTAVDFGLLSALPEIRRAAVFGFLTTRPTLLVTSTPRPARTKDLKPISEAQQLAPFCQMARRHSRST